jgi:hypothetical protein
LTIRPSAENAELPTLKSREPLWIKELDPFTINQSEFKHMQSKIGRSRRTPHLEKLQRSVGYLGERARFFAETSDETI